MAAVFKYVLPVEETHWKFQDASETAFTWNYDASSEELLRLYSKGKQQQWDAEKRIDWSLAVDADDPMQIAEEMMPLFGTPLYRRLSARQRSDLRYHSQVHNLSQFLHGEQGALICAARIVQDVPTLESKFYAATQVMDEARHVEAYRRLLKEKFRFVYPIAPPLKRLLEQALTDRRWDFTYLGMQVLIEGLALAAFQRIRDYAKNPLCQFIIAGSYFLRDRLNSEEMWEAIGIDPKDAMAAHAASEGQVRFRKRLFSRIVPTVKDIGLWSEPVQKAYAGMGVLHYADRNAQEMLDQDAAVAEEFDKLLAARASPPA
jgi:hypothetical protein